MSNFDLKPLVCTSCYDDLPVISINGHLACAGCARLALRRALPPHKYERVDPQSTALAFIATSVQATA